MMFRKEKDISSDLKEALDSNLVKKVNDSSIFGRILNTSAFFGGLIIAYEFFKSYQEKREEKKQNAWKSVDFYCQDSSNYFK